MLVVNCCINDAETYQGKVDAAIDARSSIYITHLIFHSLLKLSMSSAYILYAIHLAYHRWHTSNFHEEIWVDFAPRGVWQSGLTWVLLSLLLQLVPGYCQDPLI